MVLRASVTTTFDLVAAWSSDLEREAALLLEETADETVAKIQHMIRVYDAYDTGAMSASVYKVTPKGSTYNQANARAQTLAMRPGRHSGKPNYSYAPLRELSLAAGIKSAIVGIAAWYAYFVNYGTSRTAARPFWDEAMELMEARIAAKMQTIPKGYK